MKVGKLLAGFGNGGGAFAWRDSGVGLLLRTTCRNNSGVKSEDRGIVELGLGCGSLLELLELLELELMLKFSPSAGLRDLRSRGDKMAQIRSTTAGNSSLY